MKAYVFTTGVVFGLILLAHGARLYQEGSRLLREPSFSFSSLLCAGLVVWSYVVFRRLRLRDAASVAART